MTITADQIISREFQEFKHYWLTGDREKTCYTNPVELPLGSTVQDAIARFTAQIALYDDGLALGKYRNIPMPLDIAQAADAYLQTILDNLTDLHACLKVLNLYGSTDDATEASVNSAQDTKAVAVRNAITAYRNGWVGQFDTEQTDAQVDPAGWKQALKNFVTSKLGNLDWIRSIL